MTWIGDTLDGIVGCMTDLLDPQVCWAGVWAGSEVSWEFCGDCGDGRCGMAFVRIVDAYPSQTFPLPVEEYTERADDMPIVYRVEVGVVRCIGGIEEDGSISDPVVYAAAAEQQVVDMQVMRRAILCCTASSDTDHMLGTWTSQGPLGGCVAGSWTVMLARGAQ